MRINLLWAMAREAWVEADSEAALDLMRRAIGLLESSEDSYNLARRRVLRVTPGVRPVTASRARLDPAWLRVRSAF